MPRLPLLGVFILISLLAACRPSAPSTADDSSAVSPDAAPEPIAEAESALPPLQLFDTTLKGASRATLRGALKQGGMRAKRENDNYWTDTYDPQRVLQGATGFEAGYVDATETFAFAEYTFNSFMDTQQVQRVADLVIQKYGEPTSVDGNVQVGGVAFRWERDDGMGIRVSRGWPSTTTYLSFIDEAAFAAMQMEQEAQAQSQQAEKAREQSQAF
jgi:hypothetical protein